MSLVFLLSASLLASTFDFICNSAFKIGFHINFLKFITFTLGLIPIYVFIQRVHNQTQQRSLKSIGDEVSKINDFLIEFIIKYDQVDFDNDFDEKTLVELKVLKSKINAFKLFNRIFK